MAAVHEGRRIYDNIRRFLLYALSGGVAELLVMLARPARSGWPLPLLPAQILWINLLTHGLPGVALGAEPAEPGVMRRPPRPPARRCSATACGSASLPLGGLVAAVPLALGLWARSDGRPWQSVVFVALTASSCCSRSSLRSGSGRAGAPAATRCSTPRSAQRRALLLAVWWGPLVRLLRTAPLAPAIWRWPWAPPCWSQSPWRAPRRVSRSSGAMGRGRRVG